MTIDNVVIQFSPFVSGDDYRTGISVGRFPRFLAVVFLCLAVVLGMSIMAPGAYAGPNAPEEAEMGSEGLISVEWIFGSDQFDADGRLPGGLLIRMGSGWHAYGPVPGDLGIPPQIRFSLPPEIRVGYARFPPTMTFVEPAGISHGYESAVLIRYDLIRGDPDEALPHRPFEVDVVIMLCREICVAPRRSLRVAWPWESTEHALASRWRKALAVGGWNPASMDAATAVVPDAINTGADE